MSKIWHFGRAHGFLGPLAAFLLTNCSDSVPPIPPQPQPVTDPCLKNFPTLQGNPEFPLYETVMGPFCQDNRQPEDFTSAAKRSMGYLSCSEKPNDIRVYAYVNPEDIKDPQNLCNKIYTSVGEKIVFNPGLIFIATTFENDIGEFDGTFSAGLDLRYRTEPAAVPFLSCSDYLLKKVIQIAEENRRPVPDSADIARRFISCRMDQIAASPTPEPPPAP